jgi:hypothetical protein
VVFNKHICSIFTKVYLELLNWGDWKIIKSWKCGMGLSIDMSYHSVFRLTKQLFDKKS